MKFKLLWACLLTTSLFANEPHWHISSAEDWQAFVADAEGVTVAEVVQRFPQVDFCQRFGLVDGSFCSVAYKQASLAVLGQSKVLSISSHYLYQVPQVGELADYRVLGPGVAWPQESVHKLVT